MTVYRRLRWLVLGCMAGMWNPATGADTMGHWVSPDWPLKGKGTEWEIQYGDEGPVLHQVFYDGSTITENMAWIQPKTGVVARYELQGTDSGEAIGILRDGTLRLEDRDGLIATARPVGRIELVARAARGDQNAPAKDTGQKLDWTLKETKDGLTGKRTGHTRRAKKDGWSYFCYADDAATGCRATAPPGVLENGASVGKMTLVLSCARGRPSTPPHFVADGFPDSRYEHEAFDSFAKRATHLRMVTDKGTLHDVPATLRWTVGTSPGRRPSWQRFVPDKNLSVIIRNNHRLRVEFPWHDLVVHLREEEAAPIYAFDLHDAREALGRMIAQPEC